MKEKREKILNLIIPLLSVGTMLFVWAIAALAVDSEYILPSIGQTVSALFNVLKSKLFYVSLLFTMLRSLLAFAISFALAFVFAILAGKVKYFKSIISPIISVMRALPTIAIVLLLLFWTNSKVAPIIVTAIVVLPTSYTHIESALFALDKTVSDAGRVDGADEKAVFCMIELPQIAPALYSGIGSGISLNIKLMVAAEVIAQTAKSIGYLLNTSKVYFEIAQMLALVCIMVVLGVIIESIFNKLAKKSGSWK